MRFYYFRKLVCGHWQVMCQKQYNRFGIWCNEGEAEPLDGVQVAEEHDHALIWLQGQLIAKLNKQVAEMMDWGA